MANIVTLQILVDEDDDSRIADGLNDMLRTAAQPVDPDDADARSWIIDWRLAWAGDKMLLQPVPDEIGDAICNDTYIEGDAFPGQAVSLLPGFEYNLIATDHKAMDSLWITVPAHRSADEGGDLSVLVKRTHEGAIVDIWPTSQEDGNECLSTAAAEFIDASCAEDSAPIPA